MPYKNLMARLAGKLNERISTIPFLLRHFSLGDKTENRPAQFLAVCWIVRVEFKLHRFRDGLSVSNAPAARPIRKVGPQILDRIGKR